MEDFVGGIREISSKKRKINKLKLSAKTETSRAL